MRILFAGLGSIGQQHARILLADGKHQLFALRSGQGSGDNIPGISMLYSWEEVDAVSPEVAFITNPTFLHIRTARACAERGMHLFIEKPVDCTEDGLDGLLALVGNRRLTAYVAYPLRFHPVIVRLKCLIEGESLLHARVVCASYLPGWRPGRDPHTVYSAIRSQGGGVLLDLSHELDYCTALLGPLLSIEGKAGRLSGVTVDAEDYADLLCCFERVRVNVHLDLFSRVTRRFIEIDLPDGYIAADLIQGRIRKMKAGTEEIVECPGTKEDMLRAQAGYFFSNINNPGLDNNLAAASVLFRKILGFRKGVLE